MNSFDIVSNFATYEDYLDSLTTSQDLNYLQDESLARRLVELGYRGSGDTLNREEFESRKRELEASTNRPVQKPTQVLCSLGRTYNDFPLLQALAEREELVRSGKLSTIIFIRDINKKGQEVSGYIDYAYRLKTEDFRVYFSGRKRLLPKSSDLSYYNWETNTSTSNPTVNFQIRADEGQGLLFKSNRDRKVINVDPTADSGDNIDSSVAGLGGCPYARGASGNVATEDVLYMCNGMGIETGVDMDKLLDVSHFITGQLHIRSASKTCRALMGSRKKNYFV